MKRTCLRVGSLMLLLAALAAVPAAAQMSGREKSFVDGLQKRGLLKLLEQYLADMEQEGEDPLAIKEQQTGLFEMQGLRAQTEGERATLFAKAKQKYQELIKAIQDKIKAETDQRTQDALRTRVLELKIRMGELIWIREPFDELNVLELTDKEMGDRKRVENLMREATGVFKSVIAESDKWTQEMQADPDMERRFLNTGIYERVSLFSEFAKYRTAWTQYYLAYVLTGEKFGVTLAQPGMQAPKVVKAIVEAAKLGEDEAAAAVAKTPSTIARGLSREQAEAIKKRLEEAGAVAEIVTERDFLLAEAIKKFSEFADMEGTSDEKWQSLKMLGRCYREQGLYDKAVECFRKALNGSEKEDFKIEVYYDMVQTALSAKRYADARALVEELKGKGYESLPTSFIGARLLPFLEAKIALADPQRKAGGLRMLEEMWKSNPQLRLIISPLVLKHTDLTKTDNLKPFELWIVIDRAYTAGNYEKAAEYFEQYLKITQPDDPTHAEAMFNLAACYYKLAKNEDISDEKRLDLKQKAASRFFEVTSRFPSFPSVARAGESCVLVRSEIYAENPTEENEEAYARVLKWMLENRTTQAEGSNMRWLYGLILQKQKKYLEAARQYEKMSPDSPDFYEGKYNAAVCYRLDLLESKWMQVSAADLPKLANAAVGKMEEYVRWARDTATRAEAGGDTAKQLRNRAAEVLIWAAQILVQDVVGEYQRGLRLVQQLEQDFPEQKQLQTDADKVKLDALVAQSRNEEALKVIDDILARGDGEIGQILDRWFGSMTEDVDRYIRQGRYKEVREKVLPLADEIGKRFIQHLDRKNLHDKIPYVDYQLAELHMRAQDLEGDRGAIKRFLILIKFDPYEDREAFEKNAVDVTLLTGLAQSVQSAVYVKNDNNRTMLTDNPQRAYEHLKRAAFYWSNIAEAYMTGTLAGVPREEQERLFWEAKYNLMSVYYDLHPLEQKFAPEGKAIDYHEVIRTFIRNYRASGSTFGSPAMKVQFDRLYQRVGP